MNVAAKYREHITIIGIYMTIQQFTTLKTYFTCFIALAIWLLLFWQYNHSGVPSHHLLQRADLPAISNWWGAILLPLLSWTLLTLIEKQQTKVNCGNNFNVIAINFICALSYGAVLSQSFALGYSNISSIMFPSILFFALFFKVYKAEFVLGFILSMSIVFGAVLPTIFAILIAVLAFIVHHIAQYILSFFKGKFPLTQHNK